MCLPLSLALAAEARQEAAQKPQQHYNQLFLLLKEKAKKGEGVRAVIKDEGGQSGPCLHLRQSKSTSEFKQVLFSSTGLTLSMQEPQRLLLRMRNQMRQLCYSLFCLFFHQCDIRGGLGHSKKIKEGKKKKKGNLSTQLTHPHPPSPPLSSSFPSLFLVSPILCEKLKASVVRAQSVEVAGF